MPLINTSVHIGATMTCDANLVFLNVCVCTDQDFLEAIITDSFGVAPPVVRAQSNNMELLRARIISLSLAKESFLSLSEL